MGAFSFICPICGNSDENTIGKRNGKYYCRKCISFRGQEAASTEEQEKDVVWNLNYELTEEQARLSEDLLSNYQKRINSLVYAVCGSGKTEITLRVIAYALSKGKKVGFTVPRRDVIIELCDRFRNIFSKNTVALVYGGNSKILTADLICCTTHQLYRYPRYFDLLIIDEIDAFPFQDNEVLNTFFRRSVKGNYIMLSATPSRNFIDAFKKEGGHVLELFSRFHRYPLPVPEVFVLPKIIQKIKCYRLIKEYLKNGKFIFVFTPTIKICEELFDSLNFFIRGGNYVHSKRKNRERIIKDFKDKKIKYLITTAVLERGVTIKGLQVIVFQANHNIYSSDSLIQIAGRVGRKKEEPEGKVIFLTNENNVEIEKCIRTIEGANKNLQNLFKTHT
ncbi:MAG: helicase-related protein [Bacilli bacterium]|jgi:competence protein ComFA|nr:helicase-related protein [Bacilli bacterium]MDD3841145.1 helicase-related protein [Bacilli bacterium]